MHKGVRNVCTEVSALAPWNICYVNFLAIVRSSDHLLRKWSSISLLVFRWNGSMNFDTSPLSKQLSRAEITALVATREIS
jgi:hypothetical protein